MLTLFSAITFVIVASSSVSGSSFLDDVKSRYRGIQAKMFKGGSSSCAAHTDLSSCQLQPKCVWDQNSCQRQNTLAFRQDAWAYCKSIGNAEQCNAAPYCRFSTSKNSCRLKPTGSLFYLKDERKGKLHPKSPTDSAEGTMSNDRTARSDNGDGDGEPEAVWDDTVEETGAQEMVAKEVNGKKRGLRGLFGGLGIPKRGGQNGPVVSGDPLTQEMGAKEPSPVNGKKRDLGSLFGGFVIPKRGRQNEPVVSEDALTQEMGAEEPWYDAEDEYVEGDEKTGAEEPWYDAEDGYVEGDEKTGAEEPSPVNGKKRDLRDSIEHDQYWDEHFKNGGYY